MREDLITSAVQFLTDPAVAGSTLEKRLEFLQSKKMTQEEIEEALKRAESAPSATSAAPTTASSSTGQAIPNTISSVGPVGGYRQQSYMLAPPPVPRRDWKDYFVMATVSVGVAYGIYEVARRYVLPMIVPPTPASLEADKAALEAEFERTEALVEQLHKDTEELKNSEKLRSEVFEKVMDDARRAIENVQSQADDRKQDLRLLRTHVEALQELLPKALEKHRENQDAALLDLQSELKSLKQLVGNRKTGGPPPASAVLNGLPTAAGSSTGTGSKPFIPTPGASNSVTSGNSGPSSSSSTVPSAGAASTGSTFVPPVPSSAPSKFTPPAPEAVSSTAGSANTGSGSKGTGETKSNAPSGIPAWQLAAAKDSS